MLRVSPFRDGWLNIGMYLNRAVDPRRCRLLFVNPTLTSNPTIDDLRLIVIRTLL